MGQSRGRGGAEGKRQRRRPREEGSRGWRKTAPQFWGGLGRESAALSTAHPPPRSAAKRQPRRRPPLWLTDFPDPHCPCLCSIQPLEICRSLQLTQRWRDDIGIWRIKARNAGQTACDSTPPTPTRANPSLGILLGSPTSCQIFKKVNILGL